VEVSSILHKSFQVAQATGRRMQYEWKVRHSAEELQKSRDLELRAALRMSSASLEV